MPSCSVRWCGRSTKRSSFSKDGITFHRYPKIPEIKQKWINAAHRENWYPTKNSSICSRHFTPDCFEYLRDRRRLVSSATPTLFLPIGNSSLDRQADLQTKSFTPLRGYQCDDLPEPSCDSISATDSSNEKPEEVGNECKNDLELSETTMILEPERRTVQLWVHRYADSGHIDCRRPGPRAIAYTDASPRHRDVVATHLADPLATTRSTAAKHNVTLQTVRNHLRATKFSTPSDREKSIIARVYHFLEEEYKELSKIYKDVDLSRLSNCRERTAKATGVSEATVMKVLAEKCPKNDHRVQEPPEKRPRLHQDDTGNNKKEINAANSTEIQMEVEALEENVATIPRSKNQTFMRKQCIGEKKPPDATSGDETLVIKTEHVDVDIPITNTYTHATKSRDPIKIEPSDGVFYEVLSHTDSAMADPVRTAVEPNEDSFIPPSRTHGTALTLNTENGPTTNDAEFHENSSNLLEGDGLIKIEKIEIQEEGFS